MNLADSAIDMVMSFKSCSAYFPCASVSEGACNLGTACM